jgi:hypothetical protein
MELPLFDSVQDDRLIWMDKRDGCYSVKSGYNLFTREILPNPLFYVDWNLNRIWKVSAPPRSR